MSSEVKKPATEPPSSNETPANNGQTTTTGTTHSGGQIPPDLNTKNELRFRENLYRLMISQLFYDGYQHIAVGLTGAISANPPCPPSNRLYNLVKLATKHETQTPLTVNNNVPSDSQTSETTEVESNNNGEINSTKQRFSSNEYNDSDVGTKICCFF